MYKRLSILIPFFLLSLIGNGVSQITNTTRTKIITPDTNQVYLDSFIIDPGTFSIKPLVNFNIIGNILRFEDPASFWKNKIFSISYRILASDFHLTSYNLDTSKLLQQEKAIAISNGYTIPVNSINNTLNQNELNYNGSLSRGFSVGNSQSLVLNSNLNLQLNGNLGNGIEVLAAISDDNIPIQANGNTQLLQEFDKVFIKISKNNTDVIAGDYDISNGSQSYFSRYYKKLQGLRIDNFSSLGEGSLSISSNIAISRGKFARQTLNVSEGNQGPYKLLGNNGERFLIVLQGSERVYYDGVLLTRGQDYDYIIDYNNAEIIFTPTTLMRRESRIIVEYEYTDQNYLRSLYAVNSEYLSKDYKLFFNIYNEQDSKNATGQIELDSTDIALLSLGEENTMGILRSGIREINPSSASENTVYYQLSISPESGDTILTYLANYQDGAVTAFFSEVQLGQGDYRISSTIGANGRVYEYVGKRNGNYLPVVQLIAPEKKQLISMGGELNILDHGKLKAETSISNFDQNRFSNTDNAFNKGMAAKLSFNYERNEEISDNKWTPHFSTSYEVLDDKFTPLNPFRNQEFNRDWNVNLLSKTREQLIFAKTGLRKGNNTHITYEFGVYDRENQFRGYRHIPRLEYKTSETNLLLTGNFLNTNGNLENSDFARPLIDISRRLGFLNNWSLRFKYLGEKNERTDSSTDILTATSFAFDEYYFYLDSPGNDLRKASFYLKKRIDRLPVDNALSEVNVINEAGLSGNFRTENTGLFWTIAYRNFDVKNQDLVKTDNTSTLLGRLDYSLDIKDGFINSVSSLNIGSGQEARREYQFIKVEKGEGTYIYLGDLNGDGQNQINEYELAVFADQADYIRVNVVNNEFIRTENQGFNQSLRISPQKLFRESSDGWKKFVSKISATSIIKLDQKQQSDGEKNGGFLSFNPADTTTVSFNALVNNVLFFNRGNPKYDFQIGHRYSSNRFAQITGYEQRNSTLYFLKTRYNPHKSFDIFNNVEWGVRKYDSEFFDNKDLDVFLVSINPKLVFRPNNYLRFISQYVFEKRNQRINDMESSRSHEVNLESTWRQASTSSLNASISLVDITYVGNSNTPVSYAILEGLNNGNNFLWNISFTKRMTGNVDLLFSYEGRKTGISPAVHIGRMQVRANF